jgi:hypothetical protein
MPPPEIAFLGLDRTRGEVGNFGGQVAQYPAIVGRELFRLGNEAGWYDDRINLFGYVHGVLTSLVILVVIFLFSH